MERRTKENVLYLGSQSAVRQHLLTISGIPYKVLQHTSNEIIDSTNLSFNDHVLAIAKHKMKHLVFPDHTNETGNTIFILTADTLMRMQHNKQILGKPKDKTDAKRMLRILRSGTIKLATGCCLEKKEWKDDSWHTIEKYHWVTPTTLEFHVPDKDMETYFEKMPHALYACGAGVIEDFGLNFLKSINGSFTAVLGLPLFELREMLEKLNF